MKTIVVKGWIVGIVILVTMFGGIYLTIGTGHWSTSRAPEPVKLETGEYSIADIRGSYPFADIEKFFGVPASLLFEAFMIPEDQRTDKFLIKDMKGMFAPVEIAGQEIEVGTDLVRVFTSLYSGMPYTSEETTHLPESAVEGLIREQKLDETQTEYWKTHTFALYLAGETPPAEETAQAEASPKPEEQTETPSEASPQVEEAPSPQEQTETAPAIEIKGRTTIGELLEHGMTKEQFLELAGVEMPDDKAIKLKDFAEANELDMDTLKTKIIESLQQ